MSFSSRIVLTALEERDSIFSKNDRNSKKLFLIVDGNSYLYRAYYAFQKLPEKGLIYGFLMMLRSLLRRYPTELFLIVFDAPGENFRHRISPEYKSNRPPIPDDLRVQRPILVEILEKMKIPCLSLSDVEADDVIGTLVKNYREKFDLVIASNDKDLAQLVDEKVLLHRELNKSPLDSKGVEALFSVRPNQISEFLAIQGDSSDNIKGIPGVGPVTAAKWLQTYGNCDQIIKSCGKIKGKAGTNLRANLERIPLNLRLTKINCQVDIGNFDLNTCNEEVSFQDLRDLSILFKKLKLFQWADSIDFLSTMASIPIDL